MNDNKPEFKEVNSTYRGVSIETSRQDLTIFELLEPLGEHLAGQRYIGSAIVLVKGNMNERKVEGTAITGHGAGDNLGLCITLILGIRDSLQSMMEDNDFSDQRTRTMFRMVFVDLVKTMNEFDKAEKEAGHG